MEQLVAVASTKPVNPIYLQGQELRKSGLLTESEIDSILELRYAEKLACINSQSDTVAETTHAYRIKSVLSLVYDIQFAEQVMTPSHYESPDKYNDYSETEFIEIVNKQEELFAKMKPHVEAIVKIHNEMAVLHKLKVNK